MAADQGNEGGPQGLSDETTIADGDWPVAPEWAGSSEPTTSRADRSPLVTRQRRALTRRSTPRLLPVLITVVVGTLALLAALWSLTLGTREGPRRAAVSENTQTVPRKGEGRTTPPSTGRTEAAKARRLPNLVGLQASEAQRALVAAGFDVRLKHVDSSRAEGQVLDQDPSNGAARTGTTVVLTVSSGPALIGVPRVVGLQLVDAREALRSRDLVVREREANATSLRPTVAAQSPSAGTKVEPRSTVVLDVTRRPVVPAKVIVPALVGVPVRDAKARLAEQGLRWTSRVVPSGQPEGTVIGQTPTAGAQLREKASVALRVSGGRPQIRVPDVTGLDIESAREELRSTGLTVVVSESSTTDPAEEGVVVNQSPSAGTTTSEGEAVTLVVGRLAS